MTVSNTIEERPLAIQCYNSKHQLCSTNQQIVDNVTKRLSHPDLSYDKKSHQPL